MSDDDPRPGSQWGTSTPEEVGIDAERLHDLITFATTHASDTRPDRDQVVRRAERLRAVLGPNADIDVVGPIPRPGATNGLILRHGHLVAEFGDTGYVDQIASATKSFLSLLCGIAFDAGLIGDVYASVFDTVPLDLLNSPRNRRISWHHLLQQTSEWNGELFGKTPTGHRGDRTEPLHEPGYYWEYNDVRVNLLARCLLELFRRPLAEVLRVTVMEPIGASNSWEWHGYSSSWVNVDGYPIQSVSGGAHWGGGLWMDSWDLARVGQLYLQGGQWKGRRILSDRWIELTRSSCDLNYMYGYTWWLQHDRDGRQVSFAAQGGGSHHCFVIPEHDLVIVVRWIHNDAWEELLDLALRLVNDADELGPIDYDMARVNRPPGVCP